ncbi:MFS transporter [Bacillus dakarensis]|uniref:MFS transporter n=1 Tax=Robertmurraya dakarensis TaxID=1926278 RepID=UPI000980D0D1|nr:MFS transporter [Bacillus dakarensis]
MKNSKAKLFSKDFIIFSVLTFFLALVYFLSIITIPVYTVDELGATQSMGGLAASIFVIGMLISRIFSGKYIEVIGRNKLFYTGIILFFLATLLYFLADNLYFLILVRFIHGAVGGMAMTVMQIAILDLIPKERRGEGISFYTLSMILATAIGPFLGVFITQHADISKIFLVCSVITALCVILSFFVKVPLVILTEEQISSLKGFHFKDFFEIRALPIALIMAIMSFSYSSILAFLTSYSMEIDLMSAASFFFIVYAVVVLISRPLTGKLFDVKGENLIIYPSFILYAVGLLFLSQAHHGITLLVAAAIIGLGYGNLQSCSQAIAVKVTPSHRVGLATSTFFICMEGGLGIGPFLLGFLLPVFGYRNMYLMLAVIVFISIFLYHFLHGKKQSYHKQLSHASLKH